MERLRSSNYQNIGELVRERPWLVSPGGSVRPVSAGPKGLPWGCWVPEGSGEVFVGELCWKALSISAPGICVLGYKQWVLALLTGENVSKDYIFFSGLMGCKQCVYSCPPAKVGDGSSQMYCRKGKWCQVQEGTDTRARGLTLPCSCRPADRVCVLDSASSSAAGVFRVLPITQWMSVKDPSQTGPSEEQQEKLNFYVVRTAIMGEREDLMAWTKFLVEFVYNSGSFHFKNKTNVKTNRKTLNED